MLKANVNAPHQNLLARLGEVQERKHIEIRSHAIVIARIVAEGKSRGLRTRPLRHQPVGVRHAHRDGPPRSRAI